jgi:hypothetical protein
MRRAGMLNPVVFGNSSLSDKKWKGIRILLKEVSG